MVKAFIVISVLVDIGLVIFSGVLLFQKGFTTDFGTWLIPFAIISRSITDIFFIFSTQKLYFIPPIQKDLLDDDLQQDDTFPYRGILTPGIFNIILSFLFIVILSNSLSSFNLSTENSNFSGFALLVAAIIFFITSIIYVFSSFIKIRKMYLTTKPVA